MLNAETRLLLKSAIRSLEALQTSLHQLVKTISERAESQQDSSDPAVQQVVTPTIGLPPAIEHYIRAQADAEPGKNRKDLLRIGIEAAAFVAAAALAIFTFRTLQQVKEQTSTAEEQSRPWLKIVDATPDDSIPNEPVLTFSSGLGATPPALGMLGLRTNIRIQNIGHGVAQDISIQPNMVFMPQVERATADFIEDEERRTCERVTPAEQLPQTFSWSAVFPDSDPITAGIRVVVSSII